MVIDSFNEIEKEIERAKIKFPLWPDDPIHAASVLSEEAGELVKAANDFVYHDGSRVEMVKEAIQIGAMVVRFLDHIAYYHNKKSEPYNY